MLTSMKFFLSTVVQFLSCLGLLKEGKEIAIGANLKRWCLLWKRKEHQAVAGSTSSCEVPPSKLGLLPDLFLSSLLRKFCLCALTHREITLHLAWREEKQYQLLPLLHLSQRREEEEWKKERFVWKKKKKKIEKGNWGGNRVLERERTVAVSLTTSASFSQCVLCGMGKGTLSFFGLVSAGMEQA